MSNPEAERRRYPRVHAPVLYRPAGAGSVYGRTAPDDVSLGGMRVRSPQELAPGSLLDIEVLLPDQWLVICSAEVVWSAGSEGGTDTYAVGLRFLGMAAEDQRRLANVLGVPSP